MKYLKQLLIIFTFSLIGEILNKLIPLPIPASVYGMFLLFLALVFKIVKLEQIEETSNFLLSIMLVFFFPSAVSIMDTFFEYKSSMLPICIIVVVSTLVVLSVTGLFSQFVSKILNSSKQKLIEDGKEHK